MADPTSLAMIGDLGETLQQPSEVQPFKIDHGDVRLRERRMVEVCAEQAACIPT